MSWPREAASLVSPRPATADRAGPARGAAARAPNATRLALSGIAIFFVFPLAVGVAVILLVKLAF